ncbi:Protein unc-50 homolog [Linum perenne]
MSETKNQWARDDPAFVVICSLLLTVATLAYCAAYDHSASHTVFVVLSVLFFHFLFSGVLLATACWLYAFDVHCNSFFPMFVMLYVIHYFLSPLLVAHGFIPVLLSNLIFMVAASYYHYLNFLGYDGKPNFSPLLRLLCRTTFFLYPIGIVIVLSPICKHDSNLTINLPTYLQFFELDFTDVLIFTCAVILSGFSPSRYFMNMYFSQKLI